MFKAIGDHAQGKRFRALHCFLTRAAINENPGKVGRLCDVTTVFFKFHFNS